ncbi:hypothetical protein Pint_36116 [Pistacia integerrima]|uniref:Uncharacterized protein n=1 Tax=Pistacia integerrima TaxID=434235 RepID=A0ACC0Y279_9ROSI|nr:hypothetical protein Pint_36116 [Pistacia integerrima]
MYCMAVNVIAFVYSGFQGYDLIYQLTSRERKVRQALCHYLDFYLDQVSPCLTTHLRPLPLKALCQRRNDILLQAAIMVLMISVKVHLSAAIRSLRLRHMELNSSLIFQRFYEQVAQDAPLKPSMDIFAVGMVVELDVCQRRNDILLQAAIMMLMISVKVRLSVAIRSLRHRHN